MRFTRYLTSAAIAATVLVSCHSPVHEPPAVTLLEPAGNSLVARVVRIRALAVSYYAIDEARLFVDDSLVETVNTGTESTFTFIWNASAETAWSRHWLQVEIQDDADRTAWSERIQVTIAGTSGPTHHHGAITQDETWYALGSPHIIDDSVDVQATLTIEPGSVVQFAAGGKLLVGRNAPGTLVADGTNALISFTGFKVARGFWDAIEFGPLTDEAATRLANCLIEDGGLTRADVIAHSRLRLDNCVIRNSGGYGVYAPDSAFFSFTGNIVTGNANSPLAIGALLPPTIGANNNLSGNDTDEISIVAYLIDRDTRWPDFGIPYRLDSVLYVGGDDDRSTRSQQLTIEPGNELRFGPAGGIVICQSDAQGELVADGSGGLITFTRRTPDLNWLGLDFWGAYGTLRDVISHCFIEGAGTEQDESGVQAGDQVILEIDNSVISDGQGYGVWCDDEVALVNFNNNVITGCSYQAMSIGAAVVAGIGSGNSFTGNDLSEDGHDGIVVSDDNLPISSSVTWRDLGVPYIVTDGVTVGQANTQPAVLTIAPGVRLEMAGTGFWVSGDTPGILVADGTPQQPITFTSFYPTPHPGDWRGINLLPGPHAQQSVLRNCIIEYAGSYGGDIICDSCAPTITGNEISHSSAYGILLEHHSPLNPDTLRAQNQFYDNASGDVGDSMPPVPDSRPQSCRDIVSQPRPSALRSFRPRFLRSSGFLAPMRNEGSR